ncbi:MAG: hypothetical protein KC433_12195 [Anaerolineales bacterium]|nr:hypothetical protein [Anaerolineales bacterium]MCB8937997.1 hypothetical protein [Ardenticatenaceae bacterium]
MTNQNPDPDQLSAADLRQRLITAQEENKKLNRVVATMVSELMTPLTVIREYAYILLDEENNYYQPLDSEQAKAVDAMKKGAVRSNELLQETKKILTKADALENLESSLVQNYRRELQEANQQLDKLNLKHDVTQQILQSATNDFLSAVNIILGFSKLMLEHPESMGGSLNSEQQEGIEAIDHHAKKMYEAIRYHIFDSLRAVEWIDKEPEPEAVTLAEIDKMIEFEVESELALETAVSINRFEARSIINLLARGWFQRNKGGVLEVTAVSDDTLRFHFPHPVEVRYNIEDILNGETGQLKFTERQRYFDSVGLATGLVEKYGGAVYAKLTGDSSCHLSFTLPNYQEDS